MKPPSEKLDRLRGDLHRAHRPWLGRLRARAHHPASADRAARADAWVHAIGLIAGTVGAIVLFVHVGQSSDAAAVAPIAIYVAGLLAMLGCSAAYNVFGSDGRSERLRRLDHAAIFLMIAGTYTPLIALRLSAAWATGLGTAVWTIAIIGIVLKLCRPRRIETISVTLYLLLGWTGLIATKELLASVEAGPLLLLLLGGLVYSGGVVFHLSDGRVYQRALWHGSVLAAAAIHYFAILSLLPD